MKFRNRVMNLCACVVFLVVIVSSAEGRNKNQVRCYILVPGVLHPIKSAYETFDFYGLCY